MHIVKNYVSEDYLKIWKIIKDKIDKHDKHDNSKGEYEDDNFMKVVINSDNDLPVGKVMKLHTVILTIPHVFKTSNNKYRPQIFLADCFYDNM